MTAELGREPLENANTEYGRCDDCRSLQDLRDMVPMVIDGVKQYGTNGRAVLVCEECAEAYK